MILFKDFHTWYNVSRIYQNCLQYMPRHPTPNRNGDVMYTCDFDNAVDVSAACVKVGFNSVNIRLFTLSTINLNSG